MWRGRKQERTRRERDYLILPERESNCEQEGGDWIVLRAARNKCVSSSSSSSSPSFRLRGKGHHP